MEHTNGFIVTVRHSGCAVALQLIRLCSLKTTGLLGLPGLHIEEILHPQGSHDFPSLK